MRTAYDWYLNDTCRLSGKECYIIQLTEVVCSARAERMQISIQCQKEMCVPRQSELPMPIPRNSVKSDHGCTSRIYFDIAGDNVTLTYVTETMLTQ